MLLTIIRGNVILVPVLVTHMMMVGILKLATLPSAAIPRLTPLIARQISSMYIYIYIYIYT